jgi:hypothetical protein
MKANVSETKRLSESRPALSIYKQTMTYTPRDRVLFTMKVPSGDEVIQAWVALHERLDSLETEIAAYRAALEFYGKGGGRKDEDAEWAYDDEGFRYSTWGKVARKALGWL